MSNVSNVENVNGATQEELAAVLGVSVRTIQRTMKDHIVYSPGNKRINIPLTLSKWRNATDGVSSGEQSAKERRANAEAELKEIELAEKRGDVCKLSDVYQTINEIVSVFTNGVKRMNVNIPRLLVKKSAPAMTNILRDEHERIIDEMWALAKDYDTSPDKSEIDDTENMPQ